MPNAALLKYAGLLQKWQKAINLVGTDTLNNIEHRHFDDSAQLSKLIPEAARNIFDLGVGQGSRGWCWP